MNEQTSPPISPDTLRELYSRLGLAPSEEEIASALLAVQRLIENDGIVAGRLSAHMEPMTAPHLRSS